MANLMITKRCNLHCQYCFADEFVNKESDEMSLDCFRQIIGFLAQTPKERIGLIGGEPTLHPEFGQMLKYLISSPFNTVSVFSNGINLEPFFNELRNRRFHILINLNEPEAVGHNRYRAILDQIDIMLNKLYMREQVGIGINIYKPDMRFDYILDVIERFHFDQVRVSVAVPNLEDHTRHILPLQYFSDMMPTVREFVRKVVRLGAYPTFDCNFIPQCLANEEDRAFIEENKRILNKSNYLAGKAICSPVLDILPNLDVIRCFAMSGYHRVNLVHFKDIHDLRRHFQLEVDAQAYGILPSNECQNCYEYLSGKCSCGCYAYRLKELCSQRQHREALYGSPYVTEGK